MTAIDPDPTEEPEGSAREALRGLPRRVQLEVLLEAARASARERRTLRALFFTAASLLVGVTLAGAWGILACGFFGGSLWLVVLVVRMERHVLREARAARLSLGLPAEPGRDPAVPW